MSGPKAWNVKDTQQDFERLSRLNLNTEHDISSVSTAAQEGVADKTPARSAISSATVDLPGEGRVHPPLLQDHRNELRGSGSQNKSVVESSGEDVRAGGKDGGFQRGDQRGGVRGREMRGGHGRQHVGQHHLSSTDTADLHQRCQVYQPQDSRASFLNFQRRDHRGAGDIRSGGQSGQNSEQHDLLSMQPHQRPPPSTVEFVNPSPPKDHHHQRDQLYHPHDAGAGGQGDVFRNVGGRNMLGGQSGQSHLQTMQPHRPPPPPGFHVNPTADLARPPLQQTQFVGPQGSF